MKIAMKNSADAARSRNFTLIVFIGAVKGGGGIFDGNCLLGTDGDVSVGIL